MFAFRHNFDAKAPPTPNDDELDGYGPGSLWTISEDAERVRVWINVGAKQTQALWADLTETSGVTKFVQLDDAPKSLRRADGYWIRVQNGGLIFAKPRHYEVRQATIVAVDHLWYTGNPNCPVWDTMLGFDRVPPTAYFGVEHKGLFFGAEGEVNSVRIHVHHRSPESVELDWRLCKNSRSLGKAEVQSALLGELSTTLAQPGKMYGGSMELTGTTFGAEDSLALAWRRVDGNRATGVVEAEVSFELTFG